jgi:hypothetical protein
MDFVAQINLADVEADFHPLLPSSGWLFFFVGDFWDQNVIPHRVFYFDGPATELVRTSPPDNLEPPEMVNTHFGLINFRSGFSLDPKFLSGIDKPVDKHFFTCDFFLSALFQPFVRQS